jgi:ABC-type uncharacterized transport system YnjBCD ATPase subunit
MTVFQGNILKAGMNVAPNLVAVQQELKKEQKKDSLEQAFKSRPLKEVIES